MISLSNRKVQFHRTGSGNLTAHLIIPKEFWEQLGINDENRTVELAINDGIMTVQKNNQ